MTNRKKKGIGFGLSGVGFITAAVVFFFTEANPDWLQPALTVVGMVAGFFGFTTVFPDTEE